VSPPPPAPASPPAAPPAHLFGLLFLDAAGQAGPTSLNAKGQVAWTSATPDGVHGRYFDGVAVVEVAGNVPARAVAVNDAGLVAGQLEQVDGPHAFAWTASDPNPPVLARPDLEPGFTSVSTGINASGQVSATLTRRGIASGFRWITDPAAPAGRQEGLPAIGAPGSGIPTTTALFINASGAIAGVSSAPDARQHAALWKRGEAVIDLGSLGGSDVSPSGLNDANQVAGTASLVGGGSHAFRWSADEGLRDLGTLGGRSSAASAINASGWVVGSSETADGSRVAFVWRDGVMQSLGVLGGIGSAAVAVNASGTVAGTLFAADGTAHVFHWTAAEGMVDINTRIVGTSQPVVQYVASLADDGSLLAMSSTGLVLLRPQQ
jgi:probable HAF family extracellular repeat protein